MKDLTLGDFCEITEDYIKAFPERGCRPADMTKIVEWLRSKGDSRADALESVLPKKLSHLPNRIQDAVKNMNMEKHFRK